MREYQVRICERLGVQFPGPTRPSGNVAMVEMRTQLAIERAGLVTLHLKAGAPELYPNYSFESCPAGSPSIIAVGGRTVRRAAVLLT